MDSMLNVVYNAYSGSIEKKEQDPLKMEQRKWIKQRDDFFDTQNKEFQKKMESGEWGPDMYMITYDNYAEFVKARTMDLIKKLKE